MLGGTLSRDYGVNTIDALESLMQKRGPHSSRHTFASRPIRRCEGQACDCGCGCRLGLRQAGTLVKGICCETRMLFCFSISIFFCPLMVGCRLAVFFLRLIEGLNRV